MHAFLPSCRPLVALSYLPPGQARSVCGDVDFYSGTRPHNRLPHDAFLRNWPAEGLNCRDGVHRADGGAAVMIEGLTSFCRYRAGGLGIGERFPHRRC